MKKLLIILSLFAVTMSYASNKNSVNALKNRSNTVIDNKSYSHMSTAELQEEVEKRSINGELSFNMGLELIKRWSNS